MSDIPVFSFCPVTDNHMPVNDGIATGWDVFLDLSDSSSKDGVIAPICVAPGDSVLLKLGVRVLSPEGWWLQLNPRSSTFAKKHLVSLVGIIDQDYEGTLMLAAKYLPPDNKNLILTHGEKIAQIIPVKLQKMEVAKVTPEEFSEISKQRGFSRGAGGFGSTGH